MITTFPLYCCPCCGYTNGDMFYDYYAHLGREPTVEEAVEYKVYRRLWHTTKESNERQQSYGTPIHRPFKMSARIRANISNTKREQFAAKRAAHKFKKTNPNQGGHSE